VDDLLDGITAELRDDQSLTSLLQSANRVTGGDITSAVELVLVRLRQGRACDEAVAAVLGRAAALLALAEDQAAAQRQAEALRQRAQAALAHSRLLRERARAARRRADAARSVLETARRRMEALSGIREPAGST